MVERYIPHQRQLVSDAFFDALFDLHLAGYLSSAEMRYWMRKVGAGLDLPEFLPRRDSKAVNNALKRQIRRRMAQGVHAAVPLPDTFQLGPGGDAPEK